ncbi:top2, partial [Symbiodinium sp. KB8]
MNNSEIQNIVKILGLQYGQTYTSTKGLRYGHLMIMADQDHDGSHIKGLVINFLHHFWPSLLKLPGFLKEFITPIVKCTKGPRVVSFFTMPEYQRWLEMNNYGKGWRIKYYKGLGTSTSAEAKEYFSNLETHMIDFCYNDESDDQLIDLAFSKRRADDRKRWLQEYRPGTHIDYSIEKMYYSEFVNKELILFSMADNLRSIPSAVDGLKPSQRKVLFSCFKRNLKHEIKVVQLAGYVSEHSAYHHGEQSLAATIIGMAQNFVGSNNINLLYPAGQFGTRLMGGKDAASPRYIFTRLNKITRYLYREEDDPLLKYQEEDGQKIEPVVREPAFSVCGHFSVCVFLQWYMPVIPMVLVNGSEGIGTGWSSSIPPYNPREIIQVLRDRPWFRGFTGEVLDKGTTGSYIIRGIGDFETDEKWTQDYKQWLEELVAGIDSKASKEEKEEVKGSKVLIGGIKSFKENHTDTTVRISPGADAVKKFK